MDEVITYGGFLHLINAYLGSNYTLEDINGYYMQDLVPDKDEFFKFFLKHNQYDYGYLLPGVQEVLKELQETYDIYIATAYLIPEIISKNGKLLEQKYNYLYENLPFIHPDKYIFINNKELLNCDIKIDDKLDNLKNASVKLLFDSYHNKDYSDEYLKSMGVIRVHSWYDIKNVLKELENESSSTKK